MSTILRQTAAIARHASRIRSFSSTTVARKDLVQDIYLREIKAYKPNPTPKDAHVGVVKQFSLPPSPQAPAVPADLASELSAYDAVEPTTASATTASASGEGTEGGAEQFLGFLEQDLPTKSAHH
ncbi:hypothetical protein AGABI1DRAFT_102489 [Agaricus bisporus var. burnettii JB137-S8]|uniref:Uncharacterized protein n=2 Tax=Agaricus bisporus var. burnettii TaxID=192524 RepID=K5WLM9_AGABU|nr:uncharacterized protein AGABI1DRAFT_102489 [Agaricus bisporus var. burnettii JB137-S8]EKM76201.1 hypothetical protein AGABI1DRAFT_102489 [Agaricus bisporus var. burnettii JB137-S8]KAF7759802.1 hypothetical protein Agabi119p4_11497 [Agaricus bisporus var. burnettii]